jgi:hypothetical protein
MLQSSSQFKFDIEAECFEKSRPDGGTGRYIGGFVSTDHMDRQGETLLQEGLDFAPFLDKGYFNDNHSADTDALVGYPSNAELRQLPGGLHKGWYVEGELLEGDGTSRADRLWKLAQDLKKAGGKRKLGFSVEGQIMDRDPRNPSRVRKAVVREVAITRCPVNTATSLDVLAKSLHAGTPGASEGPGDAGALQPQALEGISNAGAKNPKKKKLKKSEAIALLRLSHPKLSKALAEQIVNYTARHYPAPTEDTHV